MPGGAPPTPADPRGRRYARRLGVGLRLSEAFGLNRLLARVVGRPWPTTGVQAARERLPSTSALSIACAAKISSLLGGKGLISASARSTQWVMSHAILLNSTVQNLISNAIKYTAFRASLVGRPSSWR